MSMVGREFSAEMSSYRDSKTGRVVRRLTGNSANNYHLYFTDNSFTLGRREFYFLSDRSAKEPLLFNIFKMELDSGRITQITDEPEGIGHHPTKTPESEIIVYYAGNQIKKLDTQNGHSEIIFEESGEYKFSAPFISSDHKWVGLPRNEKAEVPRGPNYQGFKEAFYAVKRALITLVRLDGSQALDIFEDTHYLGHFQFSPDDSNLAMYCHEGPWNLVQQRIWLLDIAAKSVKPCFRQGEGDCVGHEFWTLDGLIFFDNRGPGHDGTITSQRNQATIPDPQQTKDAFIGFTGRDGEVLRTIPMPYYCNHYHANNDNTLLVGDEVDDLVLIDISRGAATIETLCHHGTSWYSNVTHCHPTFNWEADQILFTSDREGKLNLYLVELD